MLSTTKSHPVRQYYLNVYWRSEGKLQCEFIRVGAPDCTKEVQNISRERKYRQEHHAEDEKTPHDMPPPFSYCAASRTEGGREAGQKPIYLEPESEKPFSLAPCMCTNHALSGQIFPLTPIIMLQVY